MTRFIDKKTNWSKVVTVALTGASLTAPMFMAASAQADSFDSNGGYSQVQYRDRNRDGFDDRDIDRDGDIDRDIDRDGDIDFNDLNAGNTTVTGIVTQDLNGDRFQIRANNGQTFVVNLRGQNSVSIREGSRVRVTGLRNGDRITRATVQVLGNGNAYGNGYGNGYGRGTVRTIQGRVTRDLDGRRFEMTSQGTTYVVTVSRGQVIDVNEGDRVEVRGTLFNGNVIRDAGIRILNSGNGNYNNGNFNNVDFTGRVIDVQSQRRFTVRGENGTTYEVRSDSAIDSRISSGDRVRITGTSRGGNRVINATRVQLRGNSNGNDYNNDNYSQTVEYTGIVRSVGNFREDGRRIIVLETNNGRTVRFSTDNTWLQPGARIRIRGGVQGNLVVTPQIDPA